MEASAQQPWCGGDGRGDNPGYRATRRGRVSGGNRSSIAGRPISADAGKAAIHSEGRWEAAAIGNTNGTRPGGADGGEASDRADLRGGFPGLQLWIPSEEECDTGSGGYSYSR